MNKNYSPILPSRK